MGNWPGHGHSNFSTLPVVRKLLEVHAACAAGHPFCKEISFTIHCYDIAKRCLYYALREGAHHLEFVLVLVVDFLVRGVDVQRPRGQLLHLLEEVLEEGFVVPQLVDLRRLQELPHNSAFTSQRGLVLLARH